VGLDDPLLRDLSANPDSPFVRDASNKLVRRGYWMDMNDRTLVMVMTQGIGANLANDEKRNGVATHPHHVCYVLRIDGRLNSKHRCFVDAVRAGLQLKDRFPQHDIKVAVGQVRSSTEEARHDIVLH
jgi:hypothetical protein